MKKLLNLLVLTMLVIISCSDEQSLKKEESLVDSFLKSEVFVSLGININELDIENSSVTEDETQKFSIVLPFKNNHLKFVSGKAIKQTSYIIKVAYTFEYITSLNHDELTSALMNKNYSDKIELKVFDGTSFNFEFEEGKLDFNGTKLNHAGRTTECSSNADRFAQQVANCAARRIDDMNWWEWGWCISTLPKCWGQELVSCAVDGCPWI